VLARRHRSLFGYALLLPAFLPVAGLLVYAVAWDVVLSLTGAPGGYGQTAFPDLRHYRHLASDPEVWRAARNTLALVVTTTAVELVVGVLTALLLWRPFRGRAFVFFSVFVPWAFPATFSAFAWYWMLIPPFHTFYTVSLPGLRFGLDDVLGAGAWQVLSVAIMSVWRGSSIIAVFLLAGLNAIPDELLDVGRLEASSAWQFFHRVIAPLSRRMLALAMLVGLVVTSIEYSSMYVETGGRVTVPVLGTLAYRESVQSNHPELGAALGLVQIPFGIALAFVCLRLLRDPAARGPTPMAARDAGCAGEVPPRRAPPARRLPRRSRRALLHAAGACAALAALAFHLVPVYSTAAQAFRSVREYTRGNPFWVYDPTLEDVRGVLDNPVLWRWAWNTFVVFGVVLLVGLAVSFLGGYALARLRVRAGRALAALMVLGYVVPPTAVVAPVYRMFAHAGLDDTRIGLELRT
jgi:multiple sugar transport system permease protein